VIIVNRFPYRKYGFSPPLPQRTTPDFASLCSACRSATPVVANGPMAIYAAR